MSSGEIAKALALIGENKELRNSFIEWCRSVESKLEYKGSIRDDITKFLIDAIYTNISFEKKGLKNGLTFEFMPNVHSKVAREFIMSTPVIPDHVWEPQTSKLLVYLSTRAKNVVIGGAYFGDQTILVADHIKKNGGVVHAFELNEKQSEILRRNATINHLDNVIVVNKGLWNNNDTFLNLSDTDDLAFASIAEADKGREANTTTIDTYVKQKGLPGVDLIMLDIEGSEFNALQGAENHLKKDAGIAPNIIFEVHRSYVDWSNGLHNTEIVKYLESFGYKLYSLRDLQANYDLRGLPIELVLPEHTYLEGPPHGFNMLAIKDVSLIKNDTFRICKNVSPKYLTHKDPALHHPESGLP